MLRRFVLHSDNAWSEGECLRRRLTSCTYCVCSGPKYTNICLRLYSLLNIYPRLEKSWAHYARLCMCVCVCVCVFSYFTLGGGLLYSTFSNFTLGGGLLQCQYSYFTQGLVLTTFRYVTRSLIHCNFSCIPIRRLPRNIKFSHGIPWSMISHNKLIC